VLEPPIDPMLAKLVDELPAAEGLLFEPKWDGFRAIVFRTADDVFIQSRDRRPLDRYVHGSSTVGAVAPNRAAPEGTERCCSLVLLPRNAATDCRQIRRNSP
jgi:hypothetical protein